MIPLFKVRMAEHAADEVAKVLASGYVGQGAKVELFERQFGEIVDAPEPPLALNSCTSAIDLALHLIGVGPGDEVITTPITCTATNSHIVLRGATPVWADVDPQTGLIDPACVHELLTRKTKAIIAVDWGGEPCDYATLRSFGVPVIEDAAHALLATIGGESIAKRPGGGDYVCWSFQAIKHLTTGDGGALLAPPHQMERGRLLRWYGLDRRSSASFRCEQNITEIGFKYHMNDVAAAIGLANLGLAVATVEAHRTNAQAYGEAFGRLGRKRPAASRNSAWWLYTLLVDDVSKFIAYMKENGVDCSPVHARNDKHTAFRRHSAFRCALPGVDEFAHHEVAIPVGWWLTIEERNQIIALVQQWFEQRKLVRK